MQSDKCKNRNCECEVDGEVWDAQASVVNSTKLNENHPSQKDNNDSPIEAIFNLVDLNLRFCNSL